MFWNFSSLSATDSWASLTVEKNSKISATGSLSWWLFVIDINCPDATTATNMVVTIMIVTISTFNQIFFRFYMVLLLEVQIKMINILMIEMITLQMKLLAITMLVGKELWQLLFNKICNFTNKIHSFYSKIITFCELSRCSRNCTSELL